MSCLFFSFRHVPAGIVSCLPLLILHECTWCYTTTTNTTIRVGQFVSATSRKAYTGGGAGRAGGGGYGFSRDSRETTLANGRRRIQEVASRLRLGGHYVDQAHRLFTIAVEKNFVQGRRTVHVVAACLYITCRQEKSQHMLIDFSDALQVNVYTLGTCFLKFRRLIGLKLEILDPALYVYRFAAHLDLDDRATAVALTALRLVGRMKRDWIVAGRRPAGICAAALLIAARAHGFSRHPQDVTRILRVCGLTVTTRVKEFEQTPSASLTLEQFDRVELVNEADPPIFTHNRIMEARVRAIQENNIDLLTSGALDEPLAGKNAATKWRDLNRTSQKAEAFEELYKYLEDEVANAKNRPLVTSSSSSTTRKGGGEKRNIDEDDEGEDDSGEAVVGETQNDDDEGPDPGHPQLEASDEQELKESDREEDEPVEHPTGSVGDISDKKDGSTIDNDANNNNPERSVVPVGSSTIVYQWEKAIPRTSRGKVIVLPDHSTAEERRPPTQPVEGVLDVRSWKDEMPKEMIDDIESIFRTPTEVAQKEAIFNKINKDYIDIQAQKDRHRNNEEQAHDMSELELAEQAQGLERYRKRKDRGGGKDSSNTETTEEALLQAVANRKISRKINYDAMSAIFDDDGNFSTAGSEHALEGESHTMDFEEV
jgi:hypothetical protein